MIGICVVAFMIVAPAMGMFYLGDAPDVGEEPKPPEYFGPSRRLFELSRAW